MINRNFLYHNIENKTNFVVTEYINKIKRREIYNTLEEVSSD
jgi:hypothetical protein